MTSDDVLVEPINDSGGFLVGEDAELSVASKVVDGDDDVDVAMVGGGQGEQVHTNNDDEYGRRCVEHYDAQRAGSRDVGVGWKKSRNGEQRGGGQGGGEEVGQ